MHTFLTVYNPVLFFSWFVWWSKTWRNTFLLFMPSTHREYLLILSFVMTLAILKPVTGGRKIKMRAHGRADLRFCSPNLIWKLQFDKVAFILFYAFFYNFSETLTCTISVRIYSVAFWMALLWGDDSTRSPLMAPFNIRYSVILDQFDTGNLMQSPAWFWRRKTAPFVEMFGFSFHTPCDGSQTENK